MQEWQSLSLEVGEWILTGGQLVVCIFRSFPIFNVHTYTFMRIAFESVPSGASMAWPIRSGFDARLVLINDSPQCSARDRDCPVVQSFVFLLCSWNEYFGLWMNHLLWYELRKYYDNIPPTVESLKSTLKINFIRRTLLKIRNSTYIGVNWGRKLFRFTSSPLWIWATFLNLIRRPH